ncbi:hypothetical protein FRB94_006154 [Tulasnella sp. JGI-2019a]|nr:hypothetical protein FRB94_006154 [Tulasnella sp. JGI-2019a]
MTGHTLFACACGDESAVGPGNWEWVEGKTNIVKKHNHSSYLIGRKAVHAGKQPEPFSHGGAFPVWIEGSPVAPLAVIVVSGLQQHDDHQLVVDAIRDHIQKKKK